jgi:transposase-like protein
MATGRTMRLHAFNDLVARLGGLSHSQLTALIGAARAVLRTDLAVTTIESARAPLLACPRCQGRALHRHGHANGLQRFRCRACGRSFNSLSGTPLARLRSKSKWIDFAETMLDPAATVRRAADQTGVHRSTSFRWRHRFLQWARLDRRLPLAGIVEADEMVVLESQKGSRHLDRPPRKRGGVASKRGISAEQVCVFVARDRTGRTVDAIPGRGPVTAAQLVTHPAPVMAPDALLVTDAHAAYRAFAALCAIAHQAVNLRSGERLRGAIHVQNVNAYHSRLRTWLRHFCGVASRYLGNYCGWRWAIDGARINTPEAFLRIAVAPIHM